MQTTQTLMWGQGCLGAQMCRVSQITGHNVCSNLISQLLDTPRIRLQLLATKKSIASGSPGHPVGHVWFRSGKY